MNRYLGLLFLVIVIGIALGIGLIWHPTVAMVFYLTFQEKTQCLSAWAEELQIDKRTINARLRAGWSVERALTEPVHSCGRRKINDK